MQKSYDLIVVGTGTASSIANTCRSAGWQVAVIDHRPFGGTCAMRGCMPKKVLAHAASVIDATACLKGKGVKGEDVAMDWRELFDFKRTFTEPVPEKTEQGYTKSGIDSYHGRARFVGRQSVQVGENVLEGRYVVIAAGAEPVKLPIEGSEHLITSDEFLELETLPEKILFVGGGYIAFEFAHIASRAGAKVTIVHRGERPLEKFDPELVAWLVERTRELGVDVRVEHEVIAVEKGPSGFTVHAKKGKGEEHFTADLVVHSAGRVPALDDLDLEAGGIEHEGKRLKLNDFLQSISNPSVYAAGDVAEQGPPLTPVASVDAHAVAENLLNGNQAKPDYTGTPSVVFTTPPLAKAGLLEKEAREQGLEFEVKSGETSDWFTARHAGESCAGFKVVVEKTTGRILGAHLVGPGAEEVINLFALAIQARLTASELKRSLLAFPTASHDIGYML